MDWAIGAIMRDENKVFEEWKAANGELKNQLEEELYRLFSSHANAVVYRKLGERHPGLVNNCVFSAIRQLSAGKFRGDAKVSSWFQQIVTLRCMSYLRGHIARKAERQLEDRDFPVEQDFDARLELEEIRKTLLPPEQILLDGKLEQLSDNEMAGRLGVENPDSYAAQILVSSRWKRLKEKIRTYGERDIGNSQKEA